MEEKEEHVCNCGGRCGNIQPEAESETEGELEYGWLNSDELLGQMKTNIFHEAAAHAAIEIESVTEQIIKAREELLKFLTETSRKLTDEQIDQLQRFILRSEQRTDVLIKRVERLLNHN